jgi:hypothetical protein
VDEWVAVALEEYRTLRQESLGAIEQIQRTLQIGLVAIGVLTGFAVEAADSGEAAQAGLACASTALATLVVVMSLDELRRGVESGAHVAGVEQRIAERMGTALPLTWIDQCHGIAPPLVWETAPPLLWETHIQKIGKYRRHWIRTVALFVATLPATGLGLFRLGDGGHWWPWFSFSAGVVLLLFLVAVLYQWHMHRRLKKLNDETVETLRSAFLVQLTVKL